MDHIAEWKRIDAARDRQYQIERVERVKRQNERIARIKRFLAKHDAENVTTNGYVYDFDYKGMSGYFCDQTDRIVGAIHRPLFSEEDAACYRGMESEMRRGNGQYFVMEYCYQHFCIDGKPWSSLHGVFHLIENVIMARRQGGA